MNEYMLQIKNLADHSDAWAPERRREFLAACETYINELSSAGALIAAQPMGRGGVRIEKTDNGWSTTALDRSGETWVGYYHVRATSLEAAIELAKRNPEFAYSPTARIEVRAIKTVEKETGFEYPR